MKDRKKVGGVVKNIFERERARGAFNSRRNFIYTHHFVAGVIKRKREL